MIGLQGAFENLGIRKQVSATVSNRFHCKEFTMFDLIIITSRGKYNLLSTLDLLWRGSLFHRVCKELERARKQVGLPPKQPLLQLENSSKTACYSNSGTNLLLSSPRISRFLAGLLDCWTVGLLGIVRGLARNKPNKVSSLTGLRECVARLVAEGEQFLQPTQQDASEWLLILKEAIEKELPSELGDHFANMLKIGIEVQYKCSTCGYQDQNLPEEHMALQLPVVDSSTQRPLDSLPALLANYFATEEVEKRCHACYFDKSQKQSSLGQLPEVLLIQYMRFRGDGRKLCHNIQAGCMLKINGVDYRLTGVLVHQGATRHSGHYYSITICSETGRFFRCNDNEIPKLLSKDQFFSELMSCTMLMYEKQTVPEPNHPSVMEASTSNCKRKSSEQPITGIPNKVAPVQEQDDEEDSYPELPSPGYVPLRSAAADQNPGGQVSENLAIEEELLNLKGEISLIAGIPAKERNPEQKKKLACLKRKEKKIETQLGANVAVKPKTAADRKAAQRARQDVAAKEKEKAAAQAGMAAHRSNQDLAAKEADKAANRAQKDAQWARNTTKLTKYDGLRSKEVLEGSFHVPALEDSADAIGPMDQVCPFCKALKFKGEPPKLCCMNGKIQIPCFPRPAQEFVNLYRPHNKEAESKSKVFKKYIRSLNNSCCLSSLKANERQSRYAPTVIFQGQAHQFAGPLQARDGERAEEPTGRDRSHQHDPWTLRHPPPNC